MRVVLDTNVLISGVISSQGTPARILNLWRQGRFDPVVSKPILDELERVIHYPRIQQRYKLTEEHIELFLGSISEESIWVNPSLKISAIERDPSDNRYLECAVAGGADCIVSGDNHLLRLKEYQGIVILRPREFLAVLEVESKG